jgi:dihydroorotase
VKGVLERMAEIGLPLSVHGEVTDRDIDIFDREAVFIERVLDPIRRATPGLRVVMEHITTAEAAAYASEGDQTLAATITVQHLMLDRNDMLVGGMRPHLYCLPILKRGTHRLRLVEAAISGSPRFFLGTDSAPHPTHAKEAECCAAGCFTAPVALACLAQVFDEAGALDRLEGFASLHGPAFYGLPVNAESITLEKGASAEWPATIETGAGPVTVFNPGRPVHWRVA